MRTLYLCLFSFIVAFLFHSAGYAQSDSCSGATPYGQCTIASGTNQGATTGPEDSYAAADICALSIENTVWYQLTPVVTGFYNVIFQNVNCNNQFGLQTGVLSGSCGGPYVSEGCGYVMHNDTLSYQVILTGGVPVYVVIDGDGGDYCSFDLFMCETCGAQFDIIQDSTGIYLDATVGGAFPITYLWDFGDGNTSTQQFPTHTYASPGWYTICLTIEDGNGCMSTYCDSVQVSGVFNVNTTSSIVLSQEAIPQQEKHKLKLFPNPANDEIWLEFGDPGNERLIAQIYNSSGALVAEEILNTNTSNSRYRIPVGQLPAGMYFLQTVGERSYEGMTFIRR